MAHGDSNDGKSAWAVYATHSLIHSRRSLVVVCIGHTNVMVLMCTYPIGSDAGQWGRILWFLSAWSIADSLRGATRRGPFSALLVCWLLMPVFSAGGEAIKCQPPRQTPFDQTTDMKSPPEKDVAWGERRTAMRSDSAGRGAEGSSVSDLVCRPKL